jgi:hypothetical protein
MSLSDLASLGSFVSGVAVLVSLVFLYFQVRQVNQQVRQAERNQRSLLLQGQTARWQDFYLRLAQPDMAQLWDLTLGREGDLSTTELGQVRSIALAAFRSDEELYFQHRDGLVSDAAFASLQQRILTTAMFPRLRVLWRQSRTQFDPAFAGLVDQALSETPLSTTTAQDVLEAFNRQVAQEVAAKPTAPVGDP